MKVFRTTNSNQHALVEDDVPLPVLTSGEVLIRVRASGVTPTELLWYPTTHQKNGTERIGAIPGHEFSGVIEAVGDQVTGFDVGQEVYGMNDWFADGSTAEYCKALPEAIALKPIGISHEEAASVPIGALTAWQALVQRAGLQKGERVLVHGGAGAVGVYAVQVARFLQAHVIATASAHNLNFVRELGANQVIDYRASRFEDIADQVDVVLDTVGGETLERSWAVVKPSSRLVTIAASEEASADERVKKAFLLVEPNGKQLTEIGALLDAGLVRPVLDGIFPLSFASDAYHGLVPRQGRGKVVLRI